MLRHDYRPQRSWGKVMFLQASVILLTGGEACVVGGGVVCIVFLGGSVRGFFQGGHAWFFGGACMVFLGGGMRGSFRGAMCGPFGGACMVSLGGACVGYDDIRSMSGRYASYWNAFLSNRANMR